MTQLSKNLATHYASVVTGKDTTKNIPLTKDMAETLRANLKQWYHTRYITLPKIDDPLGEPAWEGRAWDVTIRKNEISDLQATKYVCDFATRHPMKEMCDCDKKYDLFPVEFRTRLYDLYPLEFPSTITIEQKNAILKSLGK